MNTVNTAFSVNIVCIVQHLLQFDLIYSVHYDLMYCSTLTMYNVILQCSACYGALTFAHKCCVLLVLMVYTMFNVIAPCSALYMNMYCIGIDNNHMGGNLLTVQSMEMMSYFS